jgi:hypothetical protein
MYLSGTRNNIADALSCDSHVGLDDPTIFHLIVSTPSTITASNPYHNSLLELINIELYINSIQE